MKHFIQTHQPAIRLGFFIGIFALTALVCRTRHRFAKAAALLVQRGFARLHLVQGGMPAWLDNDWPVERNPIQPE